MVINAQSAAPPQLKPLRCHTTQALKLKDVQLSKKKLSTEEKKGGRGRVDWVIPAQQKCPLIFSLSPNLSSENGEKVGSLINVTILFEFPLLF